MSLEELMELYDNWNGITRVNDDDLKTVVEDKTIRIYDCRKDLLDKVVVSFGFWNNVFTVRVK